MRRFLAALIMLMPSIALAGTCGNGYGHSSTILLQKAVGSDQTNFPYPLVGTYSVLKTSANGGQVQNTANNSISVSGPADLVFCDAASGGNALKYEVAYYDATTGAFEIWVQIPTLHTATNDSIYLFTNNSGVSTSQQDLSLWSDAGYLQVCHLADGSTLNVNCSLGGTQTNHSATAVAGKLDGAGNFSAGYVDTGSPNNGTSVTVEAWSFLTSAGSNCYSFVDNIDSGPRGYGFDLNGGCTGTAKPYVTIANGGFMFLRSNTALGLNAWNYVVMTMTGTGTSNIHIYQNAAEVGYTDAFGSQSIGTSTLNLRIGAVLVAGNNTPGYMDEVRVANSVKSQNWISTNYNVQGLPAFQIVGQSVATPTIVSVARCSSSTVGGTLSCAMPFPVTSGGYMVVSTADNGGAACSAGSITDSLGLTYTRHVVATPAIGDGYSCIWSAPITAAGADTVSVPISNGAWTVVYEVKAITTSGLVTSSSNSNQPVTVSATSPSSNSFLVCNTIGTLGLTPGGPSPSSYLFITITSPDPAFSYRYIGSATGVVSSGSQSCSFAAGRGGALAIFPVATGSTARKARSAIQY